MSKRNCFNKLWNVHDKLICYYLELHFESKLQGEYVKYNLRGKSRIQNTTDSILEKKYTEI